MKAELYHETKTKSQANGRLFLSLFLLRKSSRFCQEFLYKPVGLCTGVPALDYEESGSLTRIAGRRLQCRVRLAQTKRRSEDFAQDDCFA